MRIALEMGMDVNSFWAAAPRGILMMVRSKLRSRMGRARPAGVTDGGHRVRKGEQNTYVRLGYLPHP